MNLPWLCSSGKDDFSLRSRYNALMNILRIIGLSLALVIFPVASHALHIGNCDDETHEIEVDFYGTTKQYRLEPNEWKRVFGGARSVTLGEQRVSLPFRNSRYCIWDGHISLQSLKLHMRGR
jgi:hypothetical protein